MVKYEAISEATKQLEDSFRTVLSEAEAKVKKANLKVTTRLERGNPDEKIVEIAQLSFDIIVMGSRGLGHRGSGLGSISAKVADCAHCPVLIVK